MENWAGNGKDVGGVRSGCDGGCTTTYGTIATIPYHALCGVNLWALLNCRSTVPEQGCALFQGFEAAQLNWRDSLRLRKVPLPFCCGDWVSALTQNWDGWCAHLSSLRDAMAEPRDPVKTQTQLALGLRSFLVGSPHPFSFDKSSISLSTRFSWFLLAIHECRRWLSASSSCPAFH